MEKNKSLSPPEQSLLSLLSQRLSVGRYESSNNRYGKVIESVIRDVAQFDQQIFVKSEDNDERNSTIIRIDRKSFEDDQPVITALNTRIVKHGNSFHEEPIYSQYYPYQTSETRNSLNISSLIAIIDLVLCSMTEPKS